MLRILKKLTPLHWCLSLVIIGLLILQVELDLRLPEYIRNITTLASNGNSGDIYKEALPMLGLAFASISCTIMVAVIGSKIGTDIAAKLRLSIYDKVAEFSSKEINDFSTASLLTRTTNDVQNVQMGLVMTLRLGISAPLMAIRGLLKVNNMGMEYLTVIGLGVLVMVLLIGIVMIIVLPKFSKLQVKVDKINLVIRENLTGLRVVRAFNAEKYQEEKVEVASEDLTKTYRFINKGMAFMMPGINAVVSMVTLGVVWISGVMFYKNQDIGLAAQVPEVITYGIMILQSFIMIIMLFFFLPRAQVSAKRILEVTASSLSIKDPVNPTVPSGELKGEIEFKNVSFKYPSASGYVLKNINLKINQGEVVAFLGSTGSGKSTIVNLVPRLYDAVDGEVLVNGQNVKDYSQETLRDLIGYVPQKGVLFTGTIKSNLVLGKEDATGEEINHAIRVAQAEDFVKELDLGIDYPITQGGTNVSGGQRQRLCIARALVKNPEIFIFDDSFSALDYKTDSKLRKELKKEYKKVTNLIVAQRVGTVLTADKIVVLDKGEIVGVGNHKELMKNCEVYREMAYSQLSKEELENE